MQFEKIEKFMSPLRKQSASKSLSQTENPTEFTEVFLFGSDRYGQLGLGPPSESAKSNFVVPKFCSYNIAILQIACGAKHTALLTTSYLCYTMGDNTVG